MELALLHRGAEGWFFLPVFAIWLFACCLSIPLLLLWVWMIVDCAKNEKNEGNEKIVWILVIVLAGWIGALIYLFARRPTRKRELGR